MRTLTLPRISRMYYRAVYVHGIRGLIRMAQRWWTRRTWPEDTFDRDFGVTTTGGDAGRDLHLGDPSHAIYGSRSQPSSAQGFHALLAAQSLDHPTLTFIDVGCGKGRVLMLASLYPFRRILGVEYGRNLVDAARANLATWAHPDQQCRDIAVAWSDATTFDFPPAPSVIYLFNPFERCVMDRFVRHLEDSIRAHPRPVTVLYQNPVHADAFEHSTLFACVERRPHAHIYRAHPRSLKRRRDPAPVAASSTASGCGYV